MSEAMMNIEAVAHMSGQLDKALQRIIELEDQISTQKAAARVITSCRVAELEAEVARLLVFRTAFEHIEAHISLEPDGVAWMPLNEWQGHAAIDAAMSHSANTVGGPTPVMDAAPARQLLESSVEPSLSGAAMMVNRAGESDR